MKINLSPILKHNMKAYRECGGKAPWIPKPEHLWSCDEFHALAT
jgi:hypothetical protein